jgi:(p)ppGpp synthase/HD superfamily hydrolase
VQVQGVGNLLTNMAGCCKPVPGDAITGFITQGRGVSIHRADCRRLVQLASSIPERVIDVDWGAPDERFEVDIAIEAYDRQGLLRDVTSDVCQRAHQRPVDPDADQPQDPRGDDAPDRGGRATSVPCRSSSSASTA